MTDSLFSITPTPPTSIALGAGAAGKFSFTITCLATPDRTFDLILQALLVGADGTGHEADWLVPGPQPTLHMTGGETQTVVIAVKPTATSPVGQNRVKLAVADKARPNDTFTYSAPVVCEVTAPSSVPPPAKQFPWWIVAVAGGAVVLAGVGILIWKLASRGGATVVVDGGGRDASPPSGFHPLHVQGLLPGVQDLVLGGHPVTIDTTARTIDGAPSTHFVQQGDHAVLFANAFAVQSPLVITGKPALIIVANDQVTITANVDVQVGGPGAVPAASPGAGRAGGVAQTSPLGPHVCAGGGGGGYGTSGGPGGSNWPSGAAPGAVGTPYGGHAEDPLIGGAPGGNGGHGAGAAEWGLGGGGGGALQISSAVSINVIATINAGGGGGGGGRTGEIGGGGGGAGGEILLEAPVITVSGTLVANGGGGGGGGGNGVTAGTDGSAGIPGPGRSPGGGGGLPQGSPGGEGAGGTTSSFADATPGSSFNLNGGGGGGGAGRIWLRHRAATPPNTTGRISPPASLDPTLP